MLSLLANAVQVAKEVCRLGGLPAHVALARPGLAVELTHETPRPGSMLLDGPFPGPVLLLQAAHELARLKSHPAHGRPHGGDGRGSLSKVRHERASQTAHVTCGWHRSSSLVDPLATVEPVFGTAVAGGAPLLLRAD